MLNKSAIKHRVSNSKDNPYLLTVTNDLMIKSPYTIAKRGSQYEHKTLIPKKSGLFDSNQRREASDYKKNIMDMKGDHLKIRPANIGYRYSDGPHNLELTQQTKKAISLIDLDKINDKKKIKENTYRKMMILLNKQQKKINSSPKETLKMQESPRAN